MNNKPTGNAYLNGEENKLIRCTKFKAIDWIKYIWFSITMSFAFVFLYIFHGAYLNDSYKIIVDINFYNEAHFEALLIIIWLLLSIIVTYNYMKGN